jgi:hypothetical protein
MTNHLCNRRKIALRINWCVKHLISSDQNIEHRILRGFFVVMLMIRVFMWYPVIFTLPQTPSLGQCGECINHIIFDSILFLFLVHSYARNRFNTLKYLFLIMNTSFIVSFSFQKFYSERDEVNLYNEVINASITTTLTFLSIIVSSILFQSFWIIIPIVFILINCVAFVIIIKFQELSLTGIEK